MTNLKALPQYIYGMALLFLFCESALATFVVPICAPVDRLVQNAAAYVKENPNNANGYYILGRIHYLAFINKSDVAGVLKEGTPIEIAPDWLPGNCQHMVLIEHARELTLKEFGYKSWNDIPTEKSEQIWQAYLKKVKELEGNNWKPDKISEKEIFKHASEAMKNFEKAIKLDRNNALYYLGLASLIQQYTDYLKETDNKTVPEEFRNINLSQARDTYYKAYELSIREDLNNTVLPLPGLKGLISHEAGNGYIRLIDADKDAAEADKKKAEKVKENIKKLQGLKPVWVTPIIFSMNESEAPGKMFFTDKKVKFDLDGDGVSELRQWVRPEIGILVWDPQNKGEITSGRQMFGSVSWWMFFSDGYQALDGLDDNRDGVLSGKELAGISVWFDKNSNGKSEAGEVMTLEQLRIISIASRSTGAMNNWPMSEKGIKFRNGRTIPTYDWISKP